MLLIMQLLLELCQILNRGLKKFNKKFAHTNFVEHKYFSSYVTLRRVGQKTDGPDIYLWWISVDSGGPVSQIHSPHPHVGAHGIFSDFLRSAHMLKREWGGESNGKLPHLFIPGKTAALVPEFAVQDLPSTELQKWFLRL